MSVVRSFSLKLHSHGQICTPVLQWIRLKRHQTQMVANGGQDKVKSCGNGIENAIGKLYSTEPQRTPIGVHIYQGTPMEGEGLVQLISSLR
jgi:hypothetical protein